MGFAVISFDVFEHGFSDVDAGGFFDAFEAWGGVDFEDFWAVFGADDVDAGDFEA